MMEFLYFPEDKSEYIPAVLSLLVFVIAAAITMIFIIKASQKEEKKTEENYHLKEHENEN
ncbi:hypothetical protein [Halobacillus sp. BBL2006]|uniref:hypothetical protein n=1 Tax=Halobacillus sp. BBL2006 TaxID=1543706 RepID=UPI000542533F|nr:hypothetical protein [Halobacillus sp. BBL2006]KHE67605.1 hypothetical protein LD39_16670 [Halobacillus sp. BBL2006]